MKEYVWYEPLNDFIFTTKVEVGFQEYNGTNYNSVGVSVEAYVSMNDMPRKMMRCILLGEL